MIDVRNCSARDLENRLIGAADQESGFSHHRYHADHAAIGYHAIARLQTGYSLL